MKTSARYATCIGAAAALLAGCGAPGSGPQVSAVTWAGDRGRSSMLADAASHDLLYISNIYYVTVYSYPQARLQGRLTGFGWSAGECADARGDVFVIDQLPRARVLEYAHAGTKPIAELKPHDIQPVNCAIDPATGDLAVVGKAGSGAVDVFTGAQGHPTLYTDADFAFVQSCGYDDRGNLFVDGLNDARNAPVLAELRRGSQTFTPISVNARISPFGSIQWDGSHLDVGGLSVTRGSRPVPAIYRLNIRGSQGTEVGKAALGSPAQSNIQFVIAGRNVVVANWYGTRGQNYNVLFYKYPAGGRPAKVLTAKIHSPLGVAISRASRER